MNVHELTQIIDTVNIGFVVLDKTLKITYWNRCMALHSGISSDQIINKPLFDCYPGLHTPSFNKNCKAVLNFGSFAFFSQKLHHFLFPFKTDSSFGCHFKYMQQSCTLGPVRSMDNSITGLFMIVQDVTELASYEYRLIEMNSIDGLTGINNRKFLESRLREEFERHRRYKHELSVIMIDIDHFKKINDNFGHQCGDFVIKTIAGTLKNNTRKTDIITRYGGEEFCWLLLETNADGAEIAANGIRGKIEALNIGFQTNTIKVTISLGITELKDIDTVETFIKRADEALYHAKHLGRNKAIKF